MSRKRYQLGIDNVLDEWELRTSTSRYEINTNYGPTSITASYVGLEGHVGRVVVDDIQPPERLNQLDKHFVHWLGGLTMERGTPVAREAEATYIYDETA